MYYLKYKKWKINNSIAQYLTTLLFVSFILSYYHTQGEYLLYYSKLSFGEIVLMSLSITIMPFIILILFLLISKSNAISKFKSNSYVEKYTTTNNNELDNQILIKSNLKNEESLKIEINSLLYIKSDNNYCYFVFINNQSKVESKMIRITLKQTEHQLEKYLIFLRCHNSYIVNKNKVLKLVGNSSNRKIQIQNSDIFIPISRKIDKTIFDF